MSADDGETSVRDAIILMLSECCGVPGEKMHGGMSLNDDLGIYGDDAGEFMEAFVDRFSVDPSGFVFSKYFTGEGWSLLDLFRRRGQPLTIDHLVAVATRGAWFEPPAGAELRR